MKAAPILAAMDPAKAKAVTLALTEQDAAAARRRGNADAAGQPAPTDRGGRMMMRRVKRSRRWLLRRAALFAIAARADDEVAIRAAAHDGFGRIAFDWPDAGRLSRRRSRAIRCTSISRVRCTPRLRSCSTALPDYVAVGKARRSRQDAGRALEAAARRQRLHRQARRPSSIDLTPGRAASAATGRRRKARRSIRPCRRAHAGEGAAPQRPPHRRAVAQYSLSRRTIRALTFRAAGGDRRAALAAPPAVRGTRP